MGLDAPVLVNQEEVDSRAASLRLGYTLGDQGDEPATSPNGVAVTKKIGVAVVRPAHEVIYAGDQEAAFGGGLPVRCGCAGENDRTRRYPLMWSRCHQGEARRLHI